MGFQADPVQKKGGFKPDVPAPPAPVAAAAPQQPEEEPYAGGVIEAAKAIGSGMAGQSLGGLAGLAGTVLPGPVGQGAEISERVASAIQYEPKGRSGKLITKIAGLPGAGISKVADWVGERGASVPAIGAFGKGSTEALAALIGARSGLKAKPALTPEQVRVAAARDAGFTMTPKEMGAGLVPRTLASLAGEPRLAKTTTAKNVRVIDEKANLELGLPKGTELDVEVLKGIRKEAGKDYEAVRATGRVTPEAEYAADLDALAAKYANASKDFPELTRTDVMTVIDGLKKPSFEANSAVDMIAQLRESAGQAFAGRNNGLGKVYRGAAVALEKELGRHLARTRQDPALIERYQAARVRIAKTDAVQRTLVGEHINPQALRKQMEKGAPLTGGLRESAQFAEDFERSSQKPSHQATEATIMDAGAALLNAIRSGGGSLLMDILTLGGRPIARSALASRPAQWAMDPRTNLSGPAAQALGVTSMPPPPQRQQQ